MIAPSKPPSTTVESTTLRSIRPFPTVFAMAVPKTNAATKFQNPAHTTAALGDRTRVETTVATELAASWNPLMKSNVRATSRLARTNQTAPEPKDLRAPGSPVHRVHDVIEIGRELVNVFAIERRNEGAVEAVDDLMRDLIGFMLQPLDRFDVGRAAVGRRLEELPQMLHGFF